MFTGLLSLLGIVAVIAFSLDGGRILHCQFQLAGHVQAFHTDHARYPHSLGELYPRYINQLGLFRLPTDYQPPASTPPAEVAARINSFAAFTLLPLPEGRLLLCERERSWPQNLYLRCVVVTPAEEPRRKVLPPDEFARQLKNGFRPAP
jgi:hypothetical protein